MRVLGMWLVLAWLCIVMIACSVAPQVDVTSGAPGELRADIDRLLDDFHDAASKADGERYFAAMTEDAVFLGTDATERWPKQAFVEFCTPYFQQGRGWTYVPTQRHVDVDRSGMSAWFDELLHNEKYGTCRGSGVVVQRDGVWKIAQYNLSMPVPNEIANHVVAMIAGVPLPRTTVYIVRHAERADDGGERDPPLSARGRARAEHLSRMLGSVDLDAIFSTDYQRTRQTVTPTAEAQQMEVMLYASAVQVATTIAESHAGEEVLVAGHSNTVGEIMAALGVGAPPVLRDSDYGDVFIVTIDAGGGATMQHLTMD